MEVLEGLEVLEVLEDGGSEGYRGSGGYRGSDVGRVVRRKLIYKTLHNVAGLAPFKRRPSLKRNLHLFQVLLASDNNVMISPTKAV